ncbi:MAG: Sensor histidine kinase YpdA [Accumulibacter sp.]|uniref:sensor histidine kinase n=1 Tax=Accumulibacter sp. TaxID=2053492 RepID=UPI001221C42F|nr:histidine kinase [Accumulibacter sp.]QKS31476.1 MAG: histidine kinase [Candidatus Accumulibacter similis]TLD47172.1 MAG: Sensor histidine kinase YpdA [Accumulibacter sp.]
MASIKQNAESQPLPDFRNAGVMLRILLGVNLLALLAALVRQEGLVACLQDYVAMAAWLQPLLLFNLAVLALLGNRLQGLAGWSARALVVVLAATSAALLSLLWSLLTFDEWGWQGLLRAGLLAGTAAACMLSYLALRVSALSPALIEARLQALTARIRPHFLFNSLTAVISLIRLDPRRAETALEELAELFRALLRDPRQLLPIGDELALCRQYLDLEKLRLGERLQVEWSIGDPPADLLVPPMLLQPLLENAVYHGIEPAANGGTIRVGLLLRGDELHIDLANPSVPHAGHARGNHMGLDNVRERLALYYDLEARLDTSEVRLADGSREYRVHIVLPGAASR